jgi:hypothetical protein
MGMALNCTSFVTSEAFMGQMNIVPVLGESFNQAPGPIFPCIFLAFWGMNTGMHFEDLEQSIFSMD